MKKTILILALILSSVFVFAQDKPLEISGSVDTYWKYDFSRNENIQTSFDSDFNSVSLGMVDILLKKKTGKTSFLGEISFGPRGEYQSLANSGSSGQSYHIQNLYASYAATEELSLTAGFMGTFIGYEVISPLGNFNYSTSYLFTNGPFQNGGIKANYTFSSKVGFMVGLFNDQWNSYRASSKFGLNALGSQISLAPISGMNIFLNVLSGSESGTILDLTATYQITDKFKLAVNAADFDKKEDGYSGIALYPSYAITDSFSLGLRAESFKAKKEVTHSNLKNGNCVTAFTLSANLKSGSLTLIPEIRLDNASQKIFKDVNAIDTKMATQCSIAMVYGF